MAGFSSLIPLIILLVLVAVGGFVAYAMYQWSNELAERANKKMEEKNIGFTKEGGLRVGVREMADERYADKTQNVLVNVWNNAAFPNYKSRLGWNTKPVDKKASSSSATARPSAPRASSSQSKTQSSSAAHLSPPVQRGSQKRSASPVPGGWE
ncbi:hypothetical protein LTR36_009289 [Oleoguttula mirabilis]|uniref:Uncharacterized protein n=1 Tax=Oleoguttula mirabilis TaxID=1507867 RepID=A0AAV9J5L5_9PEZI|nr:hypothetical protein LTR36_009289 [Oleoguttula mirabilis]